ncbi:MAG: NDP-sugar pyrophosphorylase family protein [Zhongshania aliphaticivorans]|jgi:NDP-sugar pyrophosphorylase family protein
MQLTLLVLAAGMGSRYGGLKQLDPMGPNGETVLDYSVYDAIRAGFDKVVFVIRREFEDAFKSGIGTKFERKIEVSYAFQDLEDLPDGYAVPDGRQKPWGTAHAVRAAREMINTPFAVINADDFYGQDAYAQIARYFSKGVDADQLQLCMVGYPLQNTLSEHGAVNRGICRVEDGVLRSVEEHLEIQTGPDGRISGSTADEASVELSPNSIVSMNFWGFTPALFSEIESSFIHFLETQGQELKSECYLPDIVNNLIRSEKTKCAVIETSSTWFGVTYPNDKPFVQASIVDLVKNRLYPEKL